MKSLLDKAEVFDLMIRQLSNFFFIDEKENVLLKNIFPQVWDKLDICFKNIDNKYFSREGEAFFSPYHSGQYLIYLYIYSHFISMHDKNLADKLYYLNKIMHSCDIYHEICLPEVFFLEHPVGTVLGRAVYGNNFFAMQNCTVGGNKGIYPVLGENLKMYSGSKIIGNSIIGNNVIVSANCYIKDTNIPDNSIVFGSSPNLIIKD